MSATVHSLLALLAGVLLLAGAVTAQTAERHPLVLVTEITGPIAPPTTRHVTAVLDRAAARDAALVVLEVDTPGGLTSSTRDINQAILSSQVPVAVHVAPSGARAASAGTYILYASHFAAMAEGTNLGAATPVAMGGGSPLPGGEDDADDSATPPPALEAKRVNDAVAAIRSLAELRGRNADWAERAVREAASLSATEALDQGVIEAIAPDTAALLDQADGRVVSVDGQAQELSLANAQVERIETSIVTRTLSILANPNVALLLVVLGFYGLVFELASPGLGPGIVGVILLALGGYALNMLPVNYAGLGLVAVGLALMAAEAFSPSFGILGGGGLAAFVVGALLLIDTPVPALQVSWGVIGAIAILSLGMLVFLLGAALRTRSQPQRASTGHLLGRTAEVLSWDAGRGHVRLQGERWQGVGPADLAPGDRAIVARVEGLTVHLRRASDAQQPEEDR